MGCRGYKNFSSPGDCDFVVKNFMILYLSYKEMQQGGKIKLITKKCEPCDEKKVKENIRTHGLGETLPKDSPLYNFCAVDITEVNEMFLQQFFEKSDTYEKK